MIVVLCTYINGYISTDGSDLRVQFKGEVNVGIVSGVYRDESGRTKQRVDDSERYKKGTKESREWSMDDTRQKKIFWWVGGGELVRDAVGEEREER